MQPEPAVELVQGQWVCTLGYPLLVGPLSLNYVAHLVPTRPLNEIDEGAPTSSEHLTREAIVQLRTSSVRDGTGNGSRRDCGASLNVKSSHPTQNVRQGTGN